MMVVLRDKEYITVSQRYSSAERGTSALFQDVCNLRDSPFVQYRALSRKKKKNAMGCFIGERRLNVALLFATLLIASSCSAMKLRMSSSHIYFSCNATVHDEQEASGVQATNRLLRQGVFVRHQKVWGGLANLPETRSYRVAVSPEVPNFSRRNLHHVLANYGRCPGARTDRQQLCV
jgi:hypothetical protein